MKKFMLIAATVMVSLAASAQTTDAAKAIKKLKTYSEAAEAFKAAEASMPDEDKAFCYNKLAELANKEVDAADADYVQAQVKKDDAAMKEASAKKSAAALNAISNAKKAFALNPKAMKIGGNLQSLRSGLVNAGLDAFNGHDYATAQTCFGTYVDAKTDPMFSKVDFSKEQGFGQICYYAGLASYFNKDYKAGDKYATAAIETADTSVIKDAITLKTGILEEYAKNSQIDTAKFISEVKALYEKYPENEAIFSKLYTLYDESGNKAAAEEVIKGRLAKNPNDVMANALLGQTAQNNSKWDEAVAAYEKTVSLKPDFLAAKLNIGVCLLQKAAAIIDANTDARGNIKADVKDGVLADLNKAKTVLEEVKAADPDRMQANWSYPLERVNYILENIK